jgi:hypothetical protein
MVQIKNITSNEVVEQIEKLCESKKSGTIYLSNEKNIIAQLKLTEGDIVAVLFLSKRSVEALELIFASERFRSFKFVERDEKAIRPELDANLPPMVEILEFIRTTGSSVAKVVTTRHNGKIIDLNQVIEIIVIELTLHLGPMAAMLCEEYFDKAKDLADVMGSLDKVASEIDNADNEIEFKRLVTEKIQKI